jgi:hypothetical protein
LTFIRCVSLNKSCQPAPIKRKIGGAKGTKRSKPALSSATRTADLEQKLDGIIQLLQTSQAVKDNFPAIAQEIGNLSNRSLPSNSTSNLSPPTPAETYYSTSTDTTTRPSSIKSAELNKAGDSAWLVGNEIEFKECMELYQRELVPIFPVLPLSPEETVDTMREKRPFLSFIIYATCCKNLLRQVELVKEARAIFAHQLMVEGNKNLDLLQALIVFSSWGLTWVVRKPILTYCIQLGATLCVELGLDKPYVPEQERHGMLSSVSWAGCPRPPHLANRKGTLEERRTAISTYLLSSM